MQLDVFKNSLFSMTSLAGAVEKVPFVPSRLTQLGLFDPKPVRTDSIVIEQRQGKIQVVATTPRGAPAVQRTTEKRSGFTLTTPRLKVSDKIWAYELAGIREFGVEDDVIVAQAEVMRRMSGPTGLRTLIDVTIEHMKFGAMQGQVYDASYDSAGNLTWNLLADMFSIFGVTAPVASDNNFDLTNASPALGSVRQQCDQIARKIMRLSQGSWGPNSYIWAPCGDNFWDALIKHPEVRQSYLYALDAADLRGGTAFGTFKFGNFLFENWRGFDDGTTFSIPTNEVRFVPVNVPGLFEIAYSPAPTMDFLGTLGLPAYARVLVDEKRNEFVEIEVESYPLPYCTRPEVLLRGIRSGSDSVDTTTK
jgi:hypothetical protein